MNFRDNFIRSGVITFTKVFLTTRNSHTIGKLHSLSHPQNFNSTTFIFELWSRLWNVTQLPGLRALGSHPSKRVLESTST